MRNTTSCYEWFAEMLQQLEQELRNRGNLLTYHIYLTHWSLGQARAVIKNNADERDIWTVLESKTYYGRPNFEVDFQSIINEDWGMTEKRHVGVFVCGPQTLVKQLQRLCIKINDHSLSTNNVCFYLNKENFWYLCSFFFPILNKIYFVLFQEITLIGLILNNSKQK
jgi:hypothetical protein